MKKIIFAAFVFIGVCTFGNPRVAAQDTSSQSEGAAGTNADAIVDQQIALLRKDVRSIKKQLIAMNLTLTDIEAAKF